MHDKDLELLERERGPMLGNLDKNLPEHGMISHREKMQQRPLEFYGCGPRKRFTGIPLIKFATYFHGKFSRKPILFGNSLNIGHH